jgi:RNA polymerase sigma factor (sigma-70 family)
VNNFTPEPKSNAEVSSFEVEAYAGLPIEGDLSSAENGSINKLRATLLKEKDYSGYTETIPGFGAREFLFSESADKKNRPKLSPEDVINIVEDLTAFRLNLLKTIKSELSGEALDLAIQKTLEHEFDFVYSGRQPAYGLGIEHLQEIIKYDSDESITAKFRAHSQSNYALIKLAEHGIESASATSRGLLKKSLDNFLGARNALWVSNLPLGYKIASQFIREKRCSHLALNFHRASELGILGGVYCYDHTLGGKISTYLGVRALAMCRLEYQRSAVHHLRHSQFILQKNKIAKAEQSLLNEGTLSSEDPKVIRKMLELSEDKIANLADMTLATLAAHRVNHKVELISYDIDYKGDGKSNMLPRLTDRNAPSALEYVQKEELKELMDSALALLEANDSQLIKERYLIDTPLTQKEIAAKFGLSHQAISLREMKALNKFKRILESLGLDDFSN